MVTAEQFKPVITAFHKHVVKNYKVDFLSDEKLDLIFVEWAMNEGYTILKTGKVLHIENLVKITPLQIIEITRTHMNEIKGQNVTMEQAVSKVRKAEYVEIRHISICLILRYCKIGGTMISCEDTGKFFGMDHSNVSTSNKRIRGRMQMDKSFSGIVKNIERKIIQHTGYLK
jgi:chromosomal replication initiation ATPase DnaA